MRKFNKILIFLYLLFSILLIAKYSKGYHCSLFYFETDKETYFNNDFIKVNASWELYYDIELEISYIQIQLYDYFNKILWNSSKYHNIGIFEENWTINIQNLNLTYINHSSTVYIKFYRFIHNIETGYSDFGFVDTLNVNINKYNISCELNGFINSIKYGNDLSFTAKFFNLDNNSDLMNQAIEFKILSESFVIFEKNFVTNDSGIINVNISSLSNLIVGRNYLIFNITDINFYKDTLFIYELLVERYTTFIEILKFKNTLNFDEDIEIKIFSYYFNNTMLPLVNKTIKISIYSSYFLKFKKEYKTNSSGFLNIIISLNSLEIGENDNEFSIFLTFNGTKYLENNTLSLNLNLNHHYSLNGYNPIQLDDLLLISLIFPFLLFFSIYIYKKSKTKYKPLKDITIKF